MDKLVKTEFFNLLIDNSSLTTEEMKIAYETFMTEVLSLTQFREDYRTIYRTLSITRIEFKALQTQILYEQGEKCA